MSRIYDNWEKLVGAVLRRENDRQLAYCESFSSSSSADFSSRYSFDSAVEDVRADFSFNPFVGDAHVPTVSRSPLQKLNPADLSSRNAFSFRDVMAIEYEEIKKATRNFRLGRFGEGGYGSVFKGWVHEDYLTAVKPGFGIAVAVKRLNNEGHNEWVDEIHYLSQLRHPNLVKLVGYSFDTDVKILVYEFMPKGSLENHLFIRGNHVLTWEIRIKVSLGVARALTFLHNLEIPVIHRNIKCSHILLDDDFNPKLSDFRFAVDGPTGDMTHVETEIMGTYGYAAPEYLATGHLTTKCDVYGFGMILLELISGLRVIDTNRPKEMQNLMDWAKANLRNRKRLSQILGSRLEGQYPAKEVYKVTKIALQCASSDPRLRPRMADVVVELEKL